MLSVSPSRNGKSTVAVLRPFGEIVVSPFDVSHSPKELSKLVTLLKTLNGDTKVVMEYTGNYYLPIALFLRNNGFFRFCSQSNFSERLQYKNL